MKKFINIFTLFALFAILFASCSPEDYTLGSKDVKPEDLVEGIAFEIEHDASNPNIIYLTSLMGNNYTPLWSHPQGRSQKQKVTLKIPFPGTYEVKFGVETRGGIVYGEPVTFTVENFYAEFVNDELWTLISGGVGNEKTWYLDLDSEGVSRYFIGPLYFYGTDDSWETVTNGVKLPEGSDSWNWSPDWKGNQWLMNAADFGSMTLNLKGGANITVEHKTIASRGTETGTYMLDTKNYTMRFVDASPLHDSNRDGVVVDWGDIKILSLTENTMQLGVLRDAALSGESACLLVYNFISKEYFDNWTPGEEVEPEPSLPEGWINDISQTTSTTVKWVLSPDTPFNWAGLDGSFLNAWNSISDYPDWTGFNAEIPATYADFYLSMNSKDKTVEYVDPKGNKTTGTYELDDKGFYTFSGIIPNFNICGSINLTTSSENQWRITNIEKDALGNIKGMWVGVRDAVKDEYIVYHLIPKLGSGAVDTEAAIKKMLCAKTWKIDIAGTKFGGPLSYADPKTFPTLTDEWTPDLASNSWVMLNGDHGSMKFNIDGTVNIIQKTVKDGAFDQTNNLKGIWTYDAETYSLRVSIPILHADNFTFAVLDWGDSRIQSIGNDFLRLCVVRDPDLSGESKWLFIYNYIPAE